MSLDDHIAVAHELKIAWDALLKAQIIIGRTHGKTKELYKMLSRVIDGLLRIRNNADNVFFKENPPFEYPPYGPYFGDPSK